MSNLIERLEHHWQDWVGENDLLIVFVTTITELQELIDEHGGDDHHDFRSGSLRTDAPDPRDIGMATCNDGIKILFMSYDEAVAARIYNELF